MKRTDSLSLDTRRNSIQNRSLGHFVDYLRGLKPALLEKDLPVTVVFGNEAGDLDSMASAISIAYYKHVVNLTDPSKRERRAFVPMINIPRKDLRLRPEVIRAFEIAFPEAEEEEVHASELFSRVPFRDDVDMELLTETKELRLILTDHNHLAPFQNTGDLPNRVSGIFDHHADEGYYLDAYDRIIDPLGSCCTLAARLWMENPDAMVSYLPRELGHLLLIAILVDTASLGSSVTSESDKSCAKFLYTRLGRDPSRDARKSYFKALAGELSHAKKLLRTLNSDELLRRDCKEIHASDLKIAISTISWSIDGPDGWIARDSDSADASPETSARAIANDIIQFARSRELDMVLLLLRKGKGDLYERQIVLACKPSISDRIAERAVGRTLKRMGQDASAVRVLEYDKMDTLFRELEGHEDMDLEPLEVPGLGPHVEMELEGQKWMIRCYTQLNVDASRKKVVPALQQVLSKVAESSERVEKRQKM